MFSDRIASYLIHRFRGRALAVSPDLSSMAVLTNILQKGAAPYVRGSLVKLLLGEARGNLFLGKGCKILSKQLLRTGNNVYIGNYGYLDCLSKGGINIGDNVTIREGCWMQLTSHYDRPGARITIGDQVYIGPRCVLGAGGQISIGDQCQIGANVSLIAENHIFSGEGDIFGRETVQEGITIGRDVWIGNSVTVLDGVVVGEGSVLGAGTVLTRSVPPRSVVVGVPGRVIKER